MGYHRLEELFVQSYSRFLGAQQRREQRILKHERLNYIYIRRKTVGDIPRKEATLHQEQMPDHLVFQKVKLKLPFTSLMSLFELNSSKSLECKQEKSKSTAS